MHKLFKPTLLLAAVGVMVFGLLSSGAWFTDTVTSNESSFSSGELSIEDGQFAAFNFGTITNMAPGDKTPYVSVYIKNDGTIPLGWFGDLQVTGDPVLADALYIDYAKMEFLSTDGVTPWYSPDEFFVDGVYAYEGVAPLAGLDGFVSLNEWDGNNGMGVTPYEFMGYEEPGYMYKLTLRFGFLEGAGNEYQELGPVNVSLKVDATQVKLGALNALGVGNALAWLNNSNCQYDGSNGTPAAISAACH